MLKSEKQIQIEKERREKLIQEKPYVMQKLFKYPEKRLRGEPTPLIEFIYDDKCNMQCTHCMNSKYEKKERALTPADVAAVAVQAEEMGLAQFSISGGEPLLFDDLDDVVKAIDPDKFHISISTNGYFLDKEMAEHLKSIGVDKVKISIDSIDRRVYRQTRQDESFYDKAFAALFNAKEAGLQAVAQVLISHQNCRTEETEQLAAFCQENVFNMDIMNAKALGEWEGKEEVLIDADDARYLLELHEKYPVVHRDVFPAYEDAKGTCGMLERLLFISKYGDIMPCGFVQIAIGNIFEDTILGAIERGRTIKPLVGNGCICPSGENREFIRKYLSKIYGQSIPVDYREVFNAKEDYII